MFKQKIANSVYLVASVCLLSILAPNSIADVNFDTVWTFIYDGGKDIDGQSINDVFKDVKTLNDGTSICIGETRDSTAMRNILLIKLDPSGKLVQKKLYRFDEGGGGYSIKIAKNGDFLIGGYRNVDPFVMRTDTAGNVKWGTWFYDSLKDKSKLYRDAKVNSLCETSRGTIICAAGDEYPNNGGLQLNNYAAFLELDSTGKLLKGNQWSNITGYTIGGFCIEETDIKNYILSGNQAVFYLDTNGAEIWKKQYTMMLDGVGSEVNNVNKAKMLRDGSLMAIGQAYEGNCWTKYKSLYYDAWWSPISYAYGVNETWDTLGRQGANDKIFDFTQLGNGNLVFVGVKGGGNGNFPVWAFVTDSTGKQLLWEKEFAIQISKNISMVPLSVTATPDNGFTVVGKGVFDTESGDNAFAMHYVPKEVLNISKLNRSQLNLQTVYYTISGNKVEFCLPKSSQSQINLTICNATGKVVVKQRYNNLLNGKIVWDAATMGKGIYFYKITIDGRVSSGKIVVSSEFEKL